jgi:uncharacterized membrane protein
MHRTRSQRTRPPGRWRARAPWIVAAAFSVSGVVHLVHPSTFTSIVPDFLPAKTALVYVSGVAELACAIGLWRRDRWAGFAAAALLICIWPANFQMAFDAQHGHVLAAKIEDWARLPLQVPLIWSALQSRGTSLPRERATTCASR